MNHGNSVLCSILLPGLPKRGQKVRRMLLVAEIHIHLMLQTSTSPNKRRNGKQLGKDGKRCNFTK